MPTVPELALRGRHLAYRTDEKGAYTVTHEAHQLLGAIMRRNAERWRAHDREHAGARRSV